jgi:uncharacterized iron-regulated protein
LFRIALSLVALMSATLVGCSSTEAREGSAAEQIWDVGAKRFVGEKELASALSDARYRLLGEVHDNPAHHTIRARLIAMLAAHGAHPAVVFEQFDLEHDTALQAAQASGGDTEQIVAAGHLDRRAWSWPAHKPIVDAALAAGLPVRAANLSRAMLRGDLQAAFDHDTNAIWYARLHAAQWSDAQARALHADIAESHCGKLPEAIVPRLVLAQRMRDAAMAQSLVDAATPDGAILIAGDGHVRNDLGVPVYLHAPAQPDADSRAVSVGFVEASADETRSAEFPRQLVAEYPGFDYIWFTPPAAREDPCADLALPSPSPKPQ